MPSGGGSSVRCTTAPSRALDARPRCPGALPRRSGQAAASLEQVIAAIYAHGNRVKVALIGTQQDLGSIPSLFGHASDYAQYLGPELSYWYKAPLLVVMPAGFGFYDAGRSTAAALQALQGVSIEGTGPDSLANAATAAHQAQLARPATCAPFLRVQ